MLKQKRSSSERYNLAASDDDSSKRRKSFKNLQQGTSTSSLVVKQASVPIVDATPPPAAATATAADAVSVSLDSLLQDDKSFHSSVYMKAAAPEASVAVSSLSSAEPRRTKKKPSPRRLLLTPHTEGATTDDDDDEDMLSLPSRSPPIPRHISSPPIAARRRFVDPAASLLDDDDDDDEEKKMEPLERNGRKEVTASFDVDEDDEVENEEELVSEVFELAAMLQKQNDQVMSMMQRLQEKKARKRKQKQEQKLARKQLALRALEEVLIKRQRAVEESERGFQERERDLIHREVEISQWETQVSDRERAVLEKEQALAQEQAEKAKRRKDKKARPSSSSKKKLPVKPGVWTEHLSDFAQVTQSATVCLLDTKSLWPRSSNAISTLSRKFDQLQYPIPTDVATTTRVLVEFRNLQVTVGILNVGFQAPAGYWMDYKSYPRGTYPTAQVELQITDRKEEDKAPVKPSADDDEANSKASVREVPAEDAADVVMFVIRNDAYRTGTLEARFDSFRILLEQQQIDDERP